MFKLLIASLLTIFVKCVVKPTIAILTNPSDLKDYSSA